MAHTRYGKDVKSVDVNTAKGVAVSFNSQGDAKVHLYVTLTPKGKEPIRVYAPEAEQLNQFSVASFMQKHGALLLKDLRLSVRGQKPA